MKRRSFLASILAAGSAPAIVRAESLMVVKSRIWTPDWVQDWPARVNTDVVWQRWDGRWTDIHVGTVLPASEMHAGMEYRAVIRSVSEDLRHLARGVRLHS